MGAHVASLTRGLSYLDGASDFAGRDPLGWRTRPTGRLTVSPESLRWTPIFAKLRLRKIAAFDVPWGTVHELGIHRGMVVVSADEWPYLCFWVYDAYSFARALTDLGFSVPRMWTLPRGSVTVDLSRVPESGS